MAEKVTGQMTDKERQGMIAFLKNIFSGGNISECFLMIKEGNCEVVAIDSKSLLFVMGEQRLCKDKIDLDIGIANIKSVIKTLGEATGKFEIANNRFRIFVKGGSVRFAVLEKKEIPSAAFLSGDTAENIRNGLVNAVTIPLSYADIAKISYFTNLLENQLLTIKTVEGKVLVKSDETEKESFSCFIGKTNKELPPLSFSCKLFSDVLACLKDDDGTSKDFAPITISLAKSVPVTIKKENFMWCLAHLSPEDVRPKESHDSPAEHV